MPRGFIRPISPLTWEAGSPEVRAALERVIRPWENTPFMAGQCCKGVGVDCTHFVCAVIDELYGTTPPRPIRRWKPGIGFESLRRGAEVMREIVSLFPAARRIRAALEPGDTVVLQYGRGPGHLALVGPERNTLWHAPMGTSSKVSIAPLKLFAGRVVRAYRMNDRQNWLNHHG